MPLKCCVPRCRSNYKSERIKYISCFLFPKDPKLVELWLKNIGRTNFTPTSNSVVCIKHFTADCIIWKYKYDEIGGNKIRSTTKKAILKPYSCPTIFETSDKNFLQKQLRDKSEIICLIDDDDDDDEDRKQPSSNSGNMISQPKRPRFQYILPKNNVQIVPSPEAASEKILILKDRKDALPQSEPEIITPEVTLEDTVIAAIYSRQPLWMESDRVKPEVLDKLWAEAAREVRRSVDIVKLIWQHLQMKFFEELINLEKCKSKTSSWQYFERLRFLKVESNNKSVVVDSANSNTTTISAIPTTVEEIVIVDTSNEEKANNNQWNGTVKEPKIWCKSATSLGLVSQTVDNENALEITKDDSTFFNELLPRVKLLSNGNKTYFRQKVLAVLNKLERK